MRQVYGYFKILFILFYDKVSVMLLYNHLAAFQTDILCLPPADITCDIICDDFN